MNLNDPQDAWQMRFSKEVSKFASTLSDLKENNPWPDNSALEAAMVYLMTELWDRQFSQTDIRSAFQGAIDQLPGYAAGSEIRS